MRLSLAVATPKSKVLITHALTCIKYGTTYCKGPSVSYGKNVSSARMIALPPRNIGPAGAILIHRFPKKIESVAATKADITTKSHNHSHEYIRGILISLP